MVRPGPRLLGGRRRDGGGGVSAADLVPFRTPVRGYRFAARPPGAADPEPGQRAHLHREAGNPRDPWAVAVWTRGADGTPWRVGYLERAVAARIGARLDRGERLEAAFAGWVAEPGRRWQRLVLRVCAAQSERTAWTVSSAPSGSSRSRTAASSRRSADHARPARRFAASLSASPGSSPTST